MDCRLVQFRKRPQVLLFAFAREGIDALVAVVEVGEQNIGTCPAISVSKVPSTLDPTRFRVLQKSAYSSSDVQVARLTKVVFSDFVLSCISLLVVSAASMAQVRNFSPVRYPCLEVRVMQAASSMERAREVDITRQGGYLHSYHAFGRSPRRDSLSKQHCEVK